MVLKKKFVFVEQNLIFKLTKIKYSSTINTRASISFKIRNEENIHKIYDNPQLGNFFKFSYLQTLAIYAGEG